VSAARPQPRRLPLLVALLFAACSREAPLQSPPGETDPAVEPRSYIIEGPPGTLDDSCFQLLGSRALVALRDAPTGQFAAWELDVDAGSWTRLTPPRFRYPTAIAGGDDGALLVVDAGVRVFLATWWEAGQERSVELDGIARSALRDEEGRGWWLAGAFGERWQHLAAHLDRNGSLRFGPASRNEDLLRESGLEFTGMAAAPRGFVLATPTECSLLAWAGDASERVSWGAPLDELLPGRELSCNAAGDSRASIDAGSARATTLDTPIALFSHGDGYLLSVRRAERAGWTLVELDRSGARIGAVELPWRHAPRAIDTNRAILDRADLDSPGEPGHHEVIATRSLLSGARAASLAGLEPEAEPFEVRVHDRSTEEAALETRVLLVDRHRCVGDVQVAVDRALLAAGEPPGRYRLAAMGAAKPADVIGLAEAIGRHVPLERILLDWRTPVPEGASPIGPGVYVLDLPRSAPTTE